MPAHRPLHPNPTSERSCRRLSAKAAASTFDGPQSPCETYDRIEIPEIQPDVTRVTLQGGVCPCCAKRFKARPPEGLEPDRHLAEPSRFRDLSARGPRHSDGPVERRVEGSVRLTSARRAVNILSAALLSLSRRRRASSRRGCCGTALASDETGLRVGKANWWLVFHHGDSAVFVAHPHRSKPVVQDFLANGGPTIGYRIAWQPDGWLRASISSAWPISFGCPIRDRRRRRRVGAGVKGLFKRACAIGRRRDEPANSTLKIYLCYLTGGSTAFSF